MKTDREYMPALLSELVQVPDGRYGRVRLGYFGDNPDAGHFEVEFNGDAPELFLWDEVKTATLPLPANQKYPKMTSNYVGRYGMGGVFHPDGTKDDRYTVEEEFCGYEKARPVARFCGEFITSHYCVSGAWRDAREHNKAHRAALGI